MIDILHIKDWIQNSTGDQFRTFNHKSFTIYTTRVVRLKDGYIFTAGDYVKRISIKKDYSIWYFHPDMKSVELYDISNHSGIVCEINDLIHVFQQNVE